MSGEMEKIEALERVSKNPLVILLIVLIGLGWLVFSQKEDQKEEVLRQEKRMDRLFENTNGVIEKNTEAFEDQKQVITELKILIQNR